MFFAFHKVVNVFRPFLQKCVINSAISSSAQYHGEGCTTLLHAVAEQAGKYDLSLGRFIEW